MKQNYLLKTLVLLAALVGGVNVSWADSVTLAQWSSDPTTTYSSDASGNYTPTLNGGSRAALQSAYSSRIYFYPSVWVDGGTQSNYKLTFCSSNTSKKCGFYNTTEDNFWLQLSDNNITDYTNSSQHDNYIELSFPATGYKSVTLKAKVAGFSNNSGNFVIVTSPDGGTTWFKSTEYTTGNHYSTFNTDIDQKLAVTNCSTVKVRIIVGNDNIGRSDWRIKDIKITGESLEEATVRTVTLGVDDADHGSVTANAIGNKLADGESLTITAVENLGWAFSKWNNNEGLTSNPYSFTISGDVSMTAYYTATTTYSLTTKTNLPWAGTISRSPAGDSYNSGKTVTLTATASEGFTFTGWSTGAKTSSISVTMNENKTITANFTKNAIAHGTENATLVSWLFDGSYDISDGTGKQKIYMPTGGSFTAYEDIKATYTTTIPIVRPDYCVGDYDDYAMSLKTDDSDVWRLGQFYDTSSNYCLFFQNQKKEDTPSWTVSDYTDPTKYSRYYEATFKTTDFESMKLTLSISANNENSGMEYGVVYSIDGSTWKSLGTVTTTKGWNTFKEAEFDLPAETSHKSSNVYIRVIRKTTSNQNQDNKINYFTLKGTVKYKETLDESASYTPVAKTADVTLTRSIAANKWSTIVLPFDLASSSIATVFGEGARVAEFTSDGSDENTLNFTTTLTESKMKANQPYAIKVASAFSTATINNVNIVEGTPTQTVGETGWSFIGNYTKDSSIAASTGSASNFFFSDNTLYKATGSITLQPFRAYFQYEGETGARQLSFVIDDEGETTEIGIIRQDGTMESLARGVVYNLNGQQVKSPVKGLYIVNGRKVVIK